MCGANLASLWYLCSVHIVSMDIHVVSVFFPCIFFLHSIYFHVVPVASMWSCVIAVCCSHDNHVTFMCSHIVSVWNQCGFHIVSVWYLCSVMWSQGGFCRLLWCCSIHILVLTSPQASLLRWVCLLVGSPRSGVWTGQASPGCAAWWSLLKVIERGLLRLAPSEGISPFHHEGASFLRWPYDTSPVTWDSGEGFWHLPMRTSQ